MGSYYTQACKDSFGSEADLEMLGVVKEKAFTGIHVYLAQQSVLRIMKILLRMRVNCIPLDVLHSDPN